MSISSTFNPQGLTLSGCEQESSNAKLAARVREKDEACARAIYIASDTAGSLFTGAPNGGMVLIAGKISMIVNTILRLHFSFIGSNVKVSCNSHVNLCQRL